MAGYTLLLAALLSLTIFNHAEAAAAGQTDRAGSLFTGAIAVALFGAVVSTWIGSGLSFVRPRSKD